MKKILLNTLLFLFLAIVMAFSVRGLPGNPTPKELNGDMWKDNGPMELSPERGRYALLYSIAENHSFSFPLELAKFSTPDVAYQDGKYVSLFAPGVSFLAVPGYLLGKMFGFAQVGAFAMIAFFAILNAFLIRAIAVRLGAHPLAGTIGGVSFLLASPAFAYAVSLYQHHMSTFLILAAVWLLIGKKKKSESESALTQTLSQGERKNRGVGFWSLAGIWALFAFSIPVDYPNAFLMLPIAAAAVAKTIMVVRKPGEFTINISLFRMFAVLGVALPLAFFAWFNTMSYGNPLQLSGTLERVIEINKDDKPRFEREIIEEQMKKDKDPRELGEKSALGFFQNRSMINGLYTHLFSFDRGMVAFTPLMFFGILGMIVAFRKKMPYVALLVAIMGFDLILYSMWNDPYGGWAFGSRYLIPSYAILSVFIALALTKYARYNLILLMFFVLFVYSTGVNTLGAITTNRNPPKVEIEGLQKQTGRHEEYTYMRNVGHLDANQVKSFMFETYAANHVTAWTYYTGIVGAIITLMAGMVVALRVSIDKARRQSIKGIKSIKGAVNGRMRMGYVDRATEVAK